jgi:hypothetical protein
MSFVSTQTTELTAAAENLQGIGLVNTLGTSAGSYAATEAANAAAAG